MNSARQARCGNCGRFQVVVWQTDDDKSATGIYVDERSATGLDAGERSAADTGAVVEPNLNVASAVIDGPSPGKVDHPSSQIYIAALAAHDAATWGKTVPHTKRHTKFCLYCHFFGALCRDPEVIDLLGCAGGPSYATLKNVVLDDAAMDKLNGLFKAEVATPTIAAAHQVSQGVACTFFPPTKERFYIPATGLGAKLREWRNTASAKSKAKSKEP